LKFQKNKITGVILAGGKNSRFGAEKALAKINGIRIIDRIITVMRDVFSENIIIANNEDMYKGLCLNVYPDKVKGRGPLMGIYTALCHTSTDIFVTACDMPFINAGIMKKIVDSLDAYDAVIPRYEGKSHFLHAAYSLRCINSFKKRLDVESLKLKEVTKDLNCNIIEKFEFEDSHLPPFFNMNTRDDFILAKNYL